MKIGIDIRKYYDYGIGTYIQNLVNALQGVNGIELVYFANEEIRQNTKDKLLGEIIVDHSPKYSIRELFSISLKANAKKLDLFHAPHYTLPVRLNMPSIVTIHDIIHLRMKEYFSFAKRTYAYGMIRHACSASSAIIVDSEFGKRELLDVFPVQEKKIHVIPLGVNRSYFTKVSHDEMVQFRNSYALSKPYILYTGSLKPHKNVATLLKAMKKVISLQDVQIVFTGEAISKNTELSLFIRENGLSDCVFDIGRISLQELKTAYQAASVVVLPSYYEGFGFSMLEAMASGVPAIGARAASIPEVVGDAGLLFDPTRDEELADQINRILSSEALRNELIRKGNERALKFTWEACTARTFQLYQEVVS